MKKIICGTIIEDKDYTIEEKINLLWNIDINTLSKEDLLYLKEFLLLMSDRVKVYRKDK